MGFLCPICSEKLDKLPAEAPTQNGSRAALELNISATPCGHIFHSYCIQKWLSGYLASSKQCPCCRKDVPGLRCLPLFPTSYEENILDDSLSQCAAAGMPAVCTNEVIITSLRNQISQLDADAKYKDEVHRLLKMKFEVSQVNLENMKTNCETWMMKAKQFESYGDRAKDLEERNKELEFRLKTYITVENLLQGVEPRVKEELFKIPLTTESIRSLIEIKNVLKTELIKVNEKVYELKTKYEELREEKLKVHVKLDQIETKYKELEYVHEISRVNAGIQSSAKPVPGPSCAIITPKAFITQGLLQQATLQQTHEQPVVKSSTSVDADVDIYPISFNLKKPKPAATSKHGQHLNNNCSSKTMVTKLSKSLSPTPPEDNTPKTPHQNSTTKTLDMTSDERATDDEIRAQEDEFRIRGHAPGALLPISVNRMKKLQDKFARPVLGVSKTTTKFSYS